MKDCKLEKTGVRQAALNRFADSFHIDRAIVAARTVTSWGMQRRSAAQTARGAPRGRAAWWSPSDRSMMVMPSLPSLFILLTNSAVLVPAVTATVLPRKSSADVIGARNPFELRDEELQAGLYGATRWGPAYLAAAFAYTNHWMSTDRFAFAGDHLTASFNAQSFGGRVESGYRFATIYGGLTPYAANGATPAKNSALTSAGAELRLANGVSLIGKFDGEFAPHPSTYAGTGTVRYTW
jgi:Autotransporter beta-domain